MEKFLKIIENPIWHRQLIYGGILAVFFMAIVLLSGFHIFWALPQIALIALVKEHYLQHLEKEFNWRNFFLLQVPAYIFYILFTL